MTVHGSTRDGATHSSAGTKTETPLAETPQAATVVTRQQMQEQGAASLQDALNYAAGVRSDAYGLDSRTDSVLVRGNFPDEYVDGLRQLFNYYTSTTRTDPYLLDRIEVLRGPASMLYGQGTTGGVVNQVTKRPLAQAQREIGVQVGSFNRKQIHADLTGPITADGHWLYRLVALGRDADTQVDHVRDNRGFIAPSITWQPSAATSLTLQMRWQRDRSGSTLQFFPWRGTGEANNRNGLIPTRRFIGEPGFDRYDSDRLTGGWLFEHHLNARWTVRQNLRIAKNDVDYRSLYADSFTNPGDSYVDADHALIGRWAWDSHTHVRMVTVDQHAEGRIDTGIVQHQILVGLDALRFTQTGASASGTPQSAGGTVPPIDVYNPVHTGYTSPALTADPKSTQHQVGLYLHVSVAWRLFLRGAPVGGADHDLSVLTPCCCGCGGRWFVCIAGAA